MTRAAWYTKRSAALRLPLMHNYASHMKLIYVGKEVWEEEFMRDKLHGVDLVFYQRALPQDAADPDAEALCVFVSSPVGVAEMDRFPKLKLITTRSTGFDHIDRAEAARRGVAVASVPGYGAPTVAEFAFALILTLSRKIYDSYELVRSGVYKQDNLAGFDLAGKTIGIVGGGRIGAHAARIAKGFGMTVLVCDPFPNESLAKEIGFAYVELLELLGASDIITLHAPYTKETHHLINKESIHSIKKGAFLINTARGALVETDALVEALQNGILAGAGLDVLEEEGALADEMHILNDPHPKELELHTLLENHYLIEHPRVIVTPHVAFDTKEAVERILDTTAKNIQGFFAGKPQNLVAPDK